MIKRTIIYASFVAWVHTLFQSYYFCSIVAWFKGVITLATNNEFSAGFMSIFAVLGITAAELWITDETFGATRLVIVMVMLTVLGNTIFGVKKSLLTQRILFSKALQYEYGTPEYRNFLRRSERYAFSWKRLQFVMFKCFMLLGYLYFVKNLLDGGDTFWDFSIEILCKAPIAIFWFYEFKSIGENSTFVYGKKAKIFNIVEGIFEPRIFKFFGAKTPTDGKLADDTMDENNYIDKPHKK